MNIIITTQNAIYLLSAVMILFVIMTSLMLYDYWKNVYCRFREIEREFEILKSKLEGENGDNRSEQS
jgi:hypothetical protein